MDDHIVIPGMGGMNEDRPEFGDQPISLNEPPPPIVNPQMNTEQALNINGGIPGLDLDVSIVRDKKAPLSKSAPKKVASNFDIENRSEEFYGTTAHDPASILTCVRDVLSRVIHRMPGLIKLNELQPEIIQIYGKDVPVIRKLML